MSPKKRKNLFSKLSTFFKKKQPLQEAIPKIGTPAVAARRKKTGIAIYESELQAIGAESVSWDIETGGDLFGIWNEEPVVYLATRSGPNSTREEAHFKLDVDYLIKLSAQLYDKWGLRYFGDWHSHHRLGLDAPSGGDQDRLKRIASKNNFSAMAEFIVTFSSAHAKTKNIHLHPYLYPNLPEKSVMKTQLIVIKGVSPIREALLSTSELPEQNLGSFSSFPISGVIAPTETDSTLEPTKRLSAQTGEKVLNNALTEFGKMSSEKIEFYQKPFGYIVVVPVDANKNVAFAIANEWPYKILEVDWIDRSCGKAEEMPLSISGASLINMKEVNDIFLKAIKFKK